MIEACLYQTAGEVVPGDAGHVGVGMGGNGYVIVREGEEGGAEAIRAAGWTSRADRRTWPSASSATSRPT